MKKKLTNELGLKILAVLLSFVVWLIVDNIHNPIIYKDFNNIPVRILNESVLDEQKKVYEVLDNSDVVTVKVKGPRTAVDLLNKEDIIAVADLKEISVVETVRIVASSSKNIAGLDEIEVIKSHENLKLSIEDEKKIQLPIQIGVTGNPKDGFLGGDVGISPNIVKLSGPESAISLIDSVKVIVDIGGMSSDVKTNSEIKLYDVEGKAIENNSIKKNISTVAVEATILATKIVPLKISLFGEPLSGYMVAGEMLYEPSSVVLAGSQRALDNISEVTIPENVLDISGISENYEAVLNVASYLSAGIILDERESDGNIRIIVPIEAIMETTVLINPERIEIAMMPEGFEGSIEIEDEIEVEVFGSKQDIDVLGKYIVAALDMSVLMANLEMEELVEGSYLGQLNLGLPEGVKVKEAVTVEIQVSELEE